MQGLLCKMTKAKNLYENINNVENITMIDLYADWCVACKELEKYTFTDPRVEKILSKINLVKYDITKTKVQSVITRRVMITYFKPKQV